MGKSDITLNLEREIWSATAKQGTFGCFEVTIGWYGKERVDYITYDTRGIWRCFEIKISKSDFHSKAHNTFIGHYNYYVMTKELYDAVKDEIPPGIGVYIGKSLEKRPRRRELFVDEKILKDSMIRSLYREAEKLFKSNDPAIIQVMKRQMDYAKKEAQEYKHRYYEIMRIGREKYGRNWDKED